MKKGSSDNVARKAVEADDGSSHQTDVLTRVSAWKALVPGTHTQQGRNRKGNPKKIQKRKEERRKEEREGKWEGRGRERRAERGRKRDRREGKGREGEGH